jgi:HAD superfamily hydrolase (TIGR01549 family)
VVIEKKDRRAILFDLDETLVLTRAIEPLRRARRWADVYAAFSQTSLPNGTFEFLVSVSGLAQLGVVTKSPRTYAEKLLAHHGIEVPVVVAYHDVSRVKPHPEALLLASQKLGVEPSKCIYVGDDENDVRAAKAAAFSPVAVCWGERIDLGIEPICMSWDEVHAEIARFIVE